eukprot:CAMPEP_0174259662 /NCGR_PEP_ID=MMETSP0439-20130205/8467_1 /TAXON_ID=0 /ORGANISM="Stereomyxa ramosa, Strain Chinc5" /LENGTH=134 /DNA_ID=CAMNT_0015343645 /DNA_START=41 /DNA_END=442 /DNA_ORIENTATION=+
MATDEDSNRLHELIDTNVEEVDGVVKSGLSQTDQQVDLTKATGNTVKVELFVSSTPFGLKMKKDIQSLKFLLDAKKVEYEEFDVVKMPDKKEEMRERSGKGTLPQLYINGNFIGGYEEAADLEEDGELHTLLGV